MREILGEPVAKQLKELIDEKFRKPELASPDASKSGETGGGT